jgi:N-acetylglutamate synthase-like GNAT family acetyltransferase
MFDNKDQESARQLIISGLGEYFDEIDYSLNRDLDDISASYTNAENDFIIAEIDRRIVGTGALIQEGNDIGRIVRVSVSKSMRNRGIGKVIVEYLIELGRKRKLEQIVVETNLNWLAANSLYRRLGFKESARDDISIHLIRNL